MRASGRLKLDAEGNRCYELDAEKVEMYTERFVSLGKADCCFLNSFCSL